MLGTEIQALQWRRDDKSHLQNKSPVTCLFNSSASVVLPVDRWPVISWRHHDLFSSATYVHFTFFLQWQLVCRYSYVSDLMTSIQMVGLMLGAASIGQLSDLIGRKKSFFLAFFVMTAGGLGSAFCQSWQAYAVCRVFVGFGFGGNQVNFIRENCVYAPS